MRIKFRMDQVGPQIMLSISINLLFILTKKFVGVEPHMDHKCTTMALKPNNHVHKVLAMTITQ